MAARDEIIAYANELLDVDSFPDYGPMGMQVVGAPEVQRIACGVSASLELFERARGVGAQLLIVHHGLFLNSDPRVVDTRMRARLQALFDGDVTLAAYHLALDAHPEIGNNAMLARELDVEPDGRFAEIGIGGRLRTPSELPRFVERAKTIVGADPLVFAEGPPTIERVAIVSGRAGRFLPAASEAGYDLFFTGEAEEPSLHTARELGIHFVAGGHYATERLGVQALSAKLAERFGLEWEFLELPNPV
jgi:dinuclear metal center YbgI/SA1388 family protein